MQEPNTPAIPGGPSGYPIPPPPMIARPPSSMPSRAVNESTTTLTTTTNASTSASGTTGSNIRRPLPQPPVGVKPNLPSNYPHGVRQTHNRIQSDSLAPSDLIPPFVAAVTGRPRAASASLVPLAPAHDTGLSASQMLIPAPVLVPVHSPSVDSTDGTGSPESIDVLRPVVDKGKGKETTGFNMARSFSQFSNDSDIYVPFDGDTVPPPHGFSKPPSVLRVPSPHRESTASETVRASRSRDRQRGFEPSHDAVQPDEKVRDRERRRKGHHGRSKSRALDPPAPIYYAMPPPPPQPSQEWYGAVVPGRTTTMSSASTRLSQLDIISPPRPEKSSSSEGTSTGVERRSSFKVMNPDQSPTPAPRSLPAGSNRTRVGSLAKVRDRSTNEVRAHMNQDPIYLVFRFA